MRPNVSRFWNKVAFASQDECWLWTACINRLGYGRFNEGKGKIVGAHQFAYRITCGPPKPGMVIDHTCNTRHCVNPGHLVERTITENAQRGVALAMERRMVYRCGHPHTAENTIAGNDGCRACRRAYMRKYMQSRRASQSAPPTAPRSSPSP